MLLFALTMPAAAMAQGTAAEGVAAVVGAGKASSLGIVLLRSDVELRARLELAKAGERAALGEPLTEAQLKGSLLLLVGEALIERESERVRVAAPKPSDVARERQRIAESVGGAARLAELLAVAGATAGEIDAMAKRRAVVSTFLRANLEGVTEVTDAEARRAYEAGAHPFGKRPFAAIREPLKAWLTKRVLDEAVGRWVAVLQTRIPVQVFVPYAPASLGAK